MKEFLQQRFSRRSSSFDNSQYEGSWSRFQEWKGKLAGTVEGKFGEHLKQGKLGEHLKHITSLKRLSEKAEPETEMEQVRRGKGGKEYSDDEEEKVENEPHLRKRLLDENLPSPDESYETLKSFASSPSTHSAEGIFEDAQEPAKLEKKLGPMSKWEKLQSYFSIAPEQSRRRLIVGGCILVLVLIFIYSFPTFSLGFFMGAVIAAGGFLYFLLFHVWTSTKKLDHSIHGPHIHQSAAHNLYIPAPSESQPPSPTLRCQARTVRSC